MIKNVVFDNGGVIVKYSAESYLDVFKFDKSKQKQLDTLFVSNEWVSFAKGEITSEQFKQFALNKFPQYSSDVEKILDVENLKLMIPIYAKTLEFIFDLKKAGYKIYLLSDINEDTITYLNSAVLNFEEAFDGIVYSCRVGMVKKEGKVFDYLLNEFNLDASETLFLDDSVTNLTKARERNIVTYRFLDPDIDIDKIKKLYLDF